jgi:hypothetical protein
MKLQLDTTAKTIKVEGTVNLNELFIALKKLLPEGLWKQFSIESNTTIVWTEPVKVYPFYPYWPWWNPQPTIMYGSTGTTTPAGNNNNLTLSSGEITYALNQGTYNVEI